MRAVFFDVGETLVDETRLWGEWADWLGVPRLTFFGVLGAVIERGEHHRRVFDILRPGVQVDAEEEARASAGVAWRVGGEDLYPDAVPCLERLRAQGLFLGVAGNQPDRERRTIAALGLPVDLVTSSEGLGAEKPSASFFCALARVAGFRPEESAYVGDRLDNDIEPARAAGMTAVFLRRGPWGHLHALRPGARRADIAITALTELPDALAHRDGQA
jgi:FMN phosphatase YigB (HAD superfamily)